MLKPLDQILNSDARFTNMVGGLDETGAIRMMSITDLHALVEPLQLDPAVPSEIHEQFDKARHAFIYSWFAYDLVSLAEQQGYQTLELALREKLPPAERRKADEKRWGLGRLLERAVAHRWLMRGDFEAPPQYPGGPKICFLDVIAMFRNELAHGSRNLFPNGSLVMLQLCVDILNRLFRSEETT
ncbi:hypothetical protein [Acidiphilium sp.]|uniref:hypothetical protein n=1 Tax=Acidiphilium sp. TaxID=527 RepID=UPI002587A2AA|nr:hypothetical protein [Acidiphilium sp.]